MPFYAGHQCVPLHRPTTNPLAWIQLAMENIVSNNTRGSEIKLTAAAVAGMVGLVGAFVAAENHRWLQPASGNAKQRRVNEFVSIQFTLTFNRVVRSSKLPTDTDWFKDV